MPDGSTVLQVIEKSGLLEQLPGIDLGRQKAGIFAKITRLDTKREAGRRVEIHRPITADPKTVERRDNR